MVDIDRDLVDMCRSHLQPMHQGSFDSPKLQIHYKDGATFVDGLPSGSIDAVVVDGIDIGTAGAKYGDSLFSKGFYEHIYRVLRPGGVMAQYMSDAQRDDEVRNAGFGSLLKYGVDVWSFQGYG